MNWINIHGLMIMLAIMIPNMFFAAKNKEGFENLWPNKIVEILEQIGRFGCFGFMVLTIPGCGFGFLSDEAFALYLVIDGILTAIYCFVWIICFKKNSIFRALALSIIPSCLFIISGVLSHYWPLMISSVIFAPCHIAISYKNAALDVKR